MKPANLTREVIVEAALRLIDRDGAERLSMRRLGRELGVDPMAIYRHLPDKAALLDAVADALHTEMALAALADAATWRQHLEAFAHRMRAVLLRHPRAVTVFAIRPGSAAPPMAGVEAALARLQAAGFAPWVGLAAVSGVRGLTVGSVLAEVVTPATAADLAALLPDHPALAAAISAGHDADREFRAGLAALLDGFAASGPDQAALARPSRPSSRSSSTSRTRPTARR